MAEQSTIVTVRISKGKETVELDLAELPDEVYRAFLVEGAKVYLNKGMSKITKAAYPKEDELKAAAMAKAAENMEACKDGTIRIPGSVKAKKASGAVMTEARRLARNLVKDEMKRQGIKVSHVEASEITKAANLILADDDSLIKQAEANLAERAKVPVKLDIKSIVKVSPKKVAAAEAAAAAKKKAKETAVPKGAMVEPRQKGQPSVVRH